MVKSQRWAHINHSKRVRTMGRNGTGVKKASKSSIEIEFTYRGIRCRERIKLQPSAINLKKCERHLQAINYAIEQDTFEYEVTFPTSKNHLKFKQQTTLTLSKWLDTWLDRKEPHIKSSTYNGYYKIIKHQLKPALGHLSLTDIKKRHVREWLETQTCSNKRIANIISPLRVSLQDAYDDELIKENILYNFRFKRNEPPKKSVIDPFTAEEQTAILSQLSSQGRNLIKFAFWTGLRTSELIALEWGDIDFSRDTALIIKAKTQTAKKAETTKTKAGEREVKLLPPALEAILAQKKYTFSLGKQVFLNPRTNSPWVGDEPIRKTLWIPALKKADVRYRRPYQTRHTYASMMLSANEPLAWVSKQLGHSTVLMTAQKYATYIPDSQPEAGNKAVKLFTISD